MGSGYRQTDAANTGGSAAGSLEPGPLYRGWFHYSAKEVAMIVIPSVVTDHLSGALGEAVVRMWARLPHAVQHDLFEEAVTSRGENIRPQLAVFLHEKHPRTAASIIERTILEPDSLGG
jgi:hypothetical protein